MGEYVFGPERDREIVKNKKKGAKRLIITFSVLLALFALAFSVAAAFLPRGIKDLQEERYLKKYGEEVDAVLVDYTVIAPRTDGIDKWHLTLNYEFKSADGQVYRADYGDEWCKTHDQLYTREAEVDKMIEDGHTAKMLVADNGRCRLIDDGPSLVKKSTFWDSFIVMIVTAIFIACNITVIVVQSKKLKNFKELR